MYSSVPLSPTGKLFIKNAEAKADKRETAPVTLRTMMVTGGVLMIEVNQGKGHKPPAHMHPDHDSILYLVKGRMSVTIGEETFMAQAGDAWHHPPGVMHWSEALEDCTIIEIKNPPRQTWPDAPVKK